MLAVALGLVALAVYGAWSAYRDALELARTNPSESAVRLVLGALAAKALVGAALAFLAVRILGAAERMLVPLRFVLNNPDMVRALTGRDSQLPSPALRALDPLERPSAAAVERDAAGDAPPTP